MKYLSIFAILMVALAFINAVNGFIVTPGMFKTKSKTLKSQPNTLGKTLYKDITIGWLNVVLKIRLRIETNCFSKCFKNYKSRDFLRQDKYNKLEKSACISLIFFFFRVSHYMRLSCKKYVSSTKKSRNFFQSLGQKLEKSAFEL